LLNIIKKLFIGTNEEKHERGKFILSHDINYVDGPSFKNITEAIEATKGKVFYIHERTALEIVCLGKWKDYILQK